MASSFDQQYYALLASRIREGDPDAFTELYNATYEPLYRSVYAFLRDPNDVYDVLQEIYISIYKNIGSLKIDRLLLPWIRQITYHTCCDYVQQNRAIRDRAVALEDMVITPPRASDDNDPYSTLSGRETEERIRAALDRRPVKERQAFLLRYDSGLKLEEVAEFMGVSLATVKRYIAAARSALQADLAHLRP